MPTSSLNILTTPRLILRRQTAADIAALVELWSDPVVTAHMGGPRERGWLQNIFTETAADPFAESYDLWPVIEKGSHKLIGHCGLLDKDVEGRTEIELTYTFATHAWGKGYATEMARGLREHAFNTLGLTRLIVLIEPENTASERVALKVGMRFEKEILRDGGALRKMYVIEQSAR